MKAANITFSFLKHRLVALSPIVFAASLIFLLDCQELEAGLWRSASHRWGRRAPATIAAFVKATRALREVGSPRGGVQGSVSLIGAHAGGETCSRTGSPRWKFHPGEHNIAQILHFHVKTFGARWKEVHFSYSSFWSMTFFFSSQLVFRP